MQYIGKVKYVSPKDKYIFKGNTHQLFFEKRDYFKFEKEVRLISSLQYSNYDELLQLPIGIKLHVNIDILIEEIYLAPHATESFKSLVEMKLASQNLNKNITYSDI